MSQANLLFAGLFLPLIAAPFVGWLGTKLKNGAGWVSAICAGTSAWFLIQLGQSAGWGSQSVFQIDWVPSLGINLSFLVDGLSLFFGLVVTIVGALISVYAAYYLHETKQDTGRFFGYLLLFMFAMLGTVFSNNLFLLFMSWEITGIASFLLIGFSYKKFESQRGAQMALLVTGATGLVLLLGLIMLGVYGGSYSFYELFHNIGGMDYSAGWVTAAFLLIGIGIFGKSAQFPFHFWLPNAMAAPTPVSAYLHSAAMVKLGIFLTARIFPLFVQLDSWGTVLISIGFFTMLIGAMFSVLSHDVKAILAYTTVSQLGYLIGFYGLGQYNGVEHDFYHILNHVFYKASLFMIAGIVIHTLGVKDIRKMGGLWRVAPVAAVACAIAVAAMGGIPGTSGFISKELLLAEILSLISQQGGWSWLLLGAIVISAACLIATGIRFFVQIFLGEVPQDVSVHKPSIGFQVPPALLAFGALAFGLVPGFGELILNRLSVAGLHRASFGHLTIWHGISAPLIASVTAVTLGVVTYVVLQKRGWSVSIPNMLRLDFGYDRALSGFMKSLGPINNVLRVDRPLDYLPIILAAFPVFVGGAVLYNYGFSVIYLFLVPPRVTPIEWATVGFITLFVAGVILSKHWTTRLIALSSTGFLVSFYFMIYRAPDLALTQMLIEAVTLVLILLLLGRFPKSCEEHELKRRVLSWRKLINIVISGAVGLTMMVVVLLVAYMPNQDPIGSFFIKNTVPLAEGHNAVNTILVDFRGFDTMGEISVLVVATLGIIGLLYRPKREES